MFGALINAFSVKYSLRPDVVAALIFQESKGYPFAIREEIGSGFYNRYVKDPLLGFVPKRITKQTEKYLRAFSFGLCQIMGQVARERGFAGESLGQLFDPAINIELGCKILRAHLDRFKGSTEDAAYRAALLRYNGGGDPDYPNKVFNHILTGAYKQVM